MASLFINPESQNPAPVTTSSLDINFICQSIVKRADDGIKETLIQIIEEQKTTISNINSMAFTTQAQINMRIHAIINVRVIDTKGKESLIETTVGRVLFNEYVPKEVEFVNELLTKKALRNICQL